MRSIFSWLRTTAAGWARCGFVTKLARFSARPNPARRTALPLVELAHLMSASHAVETETETAADLAYLCGRGTSLGGLRRKCTVVDDDGLLAIGKFPSVQRTNAPSPRVRCWR